MPFPNRDRDQVHKWFPWAVLAVPATIGLGLLLYRHGTAVLLTVILLGGGYAFWKKAKHPTKARPARRPPPTLQNLRADIDLLRLETQAAIENLLRELDPDAIPQGQLGALVQRIEQLERRILS